MIESLSGSTVPNDQSPCGWCSGNGRTVYHQGQCPRVKSIEYHQDGTIKKVEFKEGV